jgi:hypothetical protein
VTVIHDKQRPAIRLGIHLADIWINETGCRLPVDSGGRLTGLILPEFAWGNPLAGSVETMFSIDTGS